MMDEKNIKADTIGNIARKYGIDTRTLKKMIELHPDLYNNLKVYFDAGKIVLPPTIVAQIYELFGNP